MTRYVPSLLVFLLVNPLFWMAAIWVDFERPLLNIDYVLILIIAVRWRWYALPVLMLSVLADVLSTLSTVFTLMSVSDLIYMLRFVNIDNVNPLYGLLAVVIVVSIVISFVYLARSAQHIARSTWIMLLSALVFVGTLDRIIVLYRSMHTQTEWISYAPNHLVFSQSLFLYRQTYGTGFGHLMANEKETGTLKPWTDKTASSRWFDVVNNKTLRSDRLRGNPLPRNLLLIVVESWGQAHDQQLDKQLFPDIEKLKQLPHIEVIDTGTVAFDGPTIRGELRELCHAVPDTMRVHATGIDQWPCLPRLLAQQGYDTRSLSVASRSMYDMGIWYPMTGIQRTYFLEDMVGKIGRCYSWPGGCDVNYFPIIAQTFSEPGQHFMYWLTSNSHFPYDKRDAINTSYACQAPINGTMCHYARIHSRFFVALQQFLLDPDLHDMEVILVGDHAPPFLNKTEEAWFSDTQVPFLHLKKSAR